MDRLKKVVAETFETAPDSINMETTPADIEMWDSLGQLSLILAIEEEFRVTIEISEMFEIMTVGDIYKILQRKGVI
jgi:acyl carrier protein